MKRSMLRTRGTASRFAGGFTLVEMLLVLVILATLAAIVVPRIAQRGEDARKTAAKSQIEIFSTALDTYQVDNGELPGVGDGLSALLEQPSENSSWKGPYLKGDVPADPWGNAYIYEIPGKRHEKGYDIISSGPDGRPGTEDDIVNT